MPFSTLTLDWSIYFLFGSGALILCVNVICFALDLGFRLYRFLNKI